jgi:2-iminobutanoate/2-iminopropanoate deaminase
VADAALKRVNPDSIGLPVGAYSHGVLASTPGDWLHVSGQVGILPSGETPAGFTEQAHAAWSNLVAILKEAGMDVDCLVKITTFLIDQADIPQNAKVRAGFLGDIRPASTLLVVKALARPEWSIEVEAVAFRPRQA